MRSLLLLSGSLCLALLGGCSPSPQARLSGSWTVDPAQIQLPKVPIPGAEERIKQSLSATSLKLRPDGSATFSSLVSFDGKWRYADGKVALEPDDQKLLGRLQLDTPTLDLEVAPTWDTMTLTLKTPVGDAKIGLKKTG